MQKLNAARVSLKHHGQRASGDQIREHLVNSKTFVDEVCHQCFGLSLSQISMSALVNDQQIRGLIEAAETALQAGDLTVALENAAVAFKRASASVHQKTAVFFAWGGFFAEGIEPASWT
jgi:NifU-like protein involved in Fe-S cluster formation